MAFQTGSFSLCALPVRSSTLIRHRYCYRYSVVALEQGHVRACGWIREPTHLMPVSFSSASYFVQTLCGLRLFGRLSAHDRGMMLLPVNHWACVDLVTRSITCSATILFIIILDSRGGKQSDCDRRLPLIGKRLPFMHRHDQMKSQIRNMPAIDHADADTS